MTGQRIKRTAAMLLCLMAVLLGAASACAQNVVTSGTTVSGTVRVYLSSIASNSQIDLTVDGSYSVGGDTSRVIARGTKISVKNAGGTLMMTMNGQTQTMGSRFKLRRHQTSGSNGVYIAQARKPQSLYPGDIELIAKGGNVQVIVHVYMEDYMRGVLPYEMDNSFPLEALKAQAVAARTYALKKMSAQSSTYDLVDTTSDQVYNGTPTGNARCEQAVTETTGVVGTVGGEYMASYYTASNGGQTESVANAWGSGSYSYLQIKDDPYDLRNSASIAKSVTLYHDGSTSIPALTQLLRDEAAAMLGVGSVAIEGITSVTPHSPKYGGNSRVYKKVDVGLRVSGYGSVTVTLDYFGQMESLCGMSINVLKNETLSVTQTVGGFKLTARRFGHGVGMSQRGAQQMAKEGIGYAQILDFYYPGITLTKYNMTRTILPSVDGTQAGASDEMITDARSAIVTLSNPLDSLNLRAQPSTSSAVLATMAHGTQVTLLEMGSAWSFVQYGTLSGYVKNEYISVQDDTVDEAPVISSSKGTATVSLADESQTLNLRAAPTVNSAILGHLRHGQVLTVLERYESWTYVQYGQLTGYVRNDYILYDAAGSTPQPTPQPSQQGEKRIAIVLPSDGLNMRMQPAADAAVVMTLPQGTMLEVTKEEVNGMIGVTLGGLDGYVTSQYVYVVTESQLSSTSVQPTPAPTAPPAAQTIRAQVTAYSGLKLRQQPDTSSRTITTMPYGSGVIVTGAMVSGFYPVTYGSLSGYASAQYLSLEDSAPAPAPTAVITPAPTPVPTATPVPPPSQIIGGQTAMVTAVSGLNLRAEPHDQAQVIATLGYGVEVTVIGESQNGFYPVRIGTLTGYVSGRYIAVGQTLPAATPTPAATAVPPAEGYRVVVDSDNGLNLRAHPNVYADVVYVLPYGMVLEVLGESENNFLYVRWGNYSGYVSKEHVTPFGLQ